MSSANEDRNPNNDETKRALSEIEESKKNIHDATLPSTEAGVTENVKLPPFKPGKTETKANRNTNRTKKEGAALISSRHFWNQGRNGLDRKQRNSL